MFYQARTFIFVLFCITSLSVHAQHGFGTFHSFEVPELLSPFERQYISTQKTAGPLSRLVYTAYGRYVPGQGFPADPTRDSSKFIYTGYNSWDTLMNEWRYDTVTNRGDIPSPMYKLYDANGRAIKHHYCYTPTYCLSRVFTYDNNNRMSSITNTDKVDSETGYRDYDNLGRLTRIYSPISADTVLYSYGSSGLDTVWLIKATGQRTLWKAFIYAAGKLAEIELFYNSSGRILYNYDSNGRLSKVYGVSLPAQGNSKRDTSVTTYTYNSSGYLENEIRIYNGVPQQQYEFAYNVYGQPTSERTSACDTTTSTWEYVSENRYHYEPPFPTRIKDKGMPGNDITLYPVPASTQLNVQFSHAGAEAICRVDVYNILGVRKHTATKQVQPGNNSIKLDLLGLASGNYFLRLTTAGKQIVRPFSIKQ